MRKVFLYTCLLVGCSSSPATVSNDATIPDMAPATTTDPDMISGVGDMSTHDANVVDMSTMSPDMVAYLDLALEPDMATAPPDLLQPADLTPPNDLTPSPDLSSCGGATCGAGQACVSGQCLYAHYDTFCATYFNTYGTYWYDSSPTVDPTSSTQAKAACNACCANGTCPYVGGCNGGVTYWYFTDNTYEYDFFYSGQQGYGGRKPKLGGSYSGYFFWDQ